MKANAPPQRSRSAWGVASTSPASLMVVTATLGIAAVSWAVAVQQMRGMDMGAATDLGSLAFFMGVWVPMMAAMMLPGAVPAPSRFVRTGRRAVVAPLFAGSYLAVWTLVGLAVYVAYRPHGSFAAGVLTIVAGCYELTPLKRTCRRRCRERVHSGFDYGIRDPLPRLERRADVAAGRARRHEHRSDGGRCARRARPQGAAAERPWLDVPVALAIVALGILILASPASVPRIVPAM